MIQIAAENQSVPELVNEHLSKKLSRLLVENGPAPFPDSRLAFVGFSAWRREEIGDANLSDEHVFAVRNGQVRFLNPRYDLETFSPDGLSWGYGGSGSAQLAIAILMEVLGDWERVKVVWPRFHDHFVMKIPKDVNWTADGADVLATALAIERHQELSSETRS